MTITDASAQTQDCFVDELPSEFAEFLDLMGETGAFIEVNWMRLFCRDQGARWAIHDVSGHGATIEPPAFVTRDLGLALQLLRDERHTWPAASSASHISAKDVHGWLEEQLNGLASDMGDDRAFGRTVSEQSQDEFVRLQDIQRQFCELYKDCLGPE